ncbi:MAG: hypothetical protein ACXAEU_15610 [Candidatus Hodarchaeales archaeon]|jgi:chromosome segregation ATPase
MSKKAKIMIIKQVKRNKDDRKQEYSLVVDGIYKNISIHPRSAYSLKDIRDYLNEVKEMSLVFIDKIFRDFSTLAVRNMGIEEEKVIEAPTTDTDSETKLLIDDLKLENENWKLKYQQLEKSSSKSFQEGEDKVAELENQVKLLNEQMMQSSDKFRDHVTEIVEELNRVQAVAEESRLTNEQLNSQVKEASTIISNIEQERNALRESIASLKRERIQINEQLAIFQDLLSENLLLRRIIEKTGRKIKKLNGKLEIERRKVMV